MDGGEQDQGPFRVECGDPGGSARAGVLRTAHGSVRTPTFMPVGTQATVKGLTPEQLEQAGTDILLANTYHLLLRPGTERIAGLGGLHRFMGWERPILTDSGGFQVMSLADRCRVSDEGVVFRSHLDGSRIALTPEGAVEAQRELAVDILMVLDECLPAGSGRAPAEGAMQRTTDWAKRSRNVELLPERLLFAIVQGGMYEDLRRAHAAQLAELDFPGYAVGGLSVGEERGRTRAVANVTAGALPAGKPRYLMGVGLPQDLLRFIGMGYDLFDCVMPTRNGRNGMVFTHDGRMNLRLARWADDPRPLDEHCACAVCRRFSRAYLRHLAVSREMLGAQLASWHNVWFYLNLMHEARDHIETGDYERWSAAVAERMDAEES